MARVIGAVLAVAGLYYLGFYVAVRPDFGAFVGCVVLGCAAVLLLLWRPAVVVNRHWPRWSVYAGAAALATLSFALADRGSHSASDTLIKVVPLLELIVSATVQLAGGSTKHLDTRPAG